MKPFPHERWPDSTLSLIRDPYRYISRRCRQLGTDAFETRLLLQRTICLRGAKAARLFYDQTRFQRHGATPGRLLKTLFGQGGVQSLDNAAHQHRRALFLNLFTPPHIADLADRTRDLWFAHAQRWTAQTQTDPQAGGDTGQQIVLYEAAKQLLCQAVCEWAEVPLRQRELRNRTQQLAALYEHAGSVGLRHWRARRQRRRAEDWLSELVQQVRRNQLLPREQSALSVISRHHDPDGRLLPPRIAAVELLNILRPVGAVSVLITQAAMALQSHPKWRSRLSDERAAETEMFVQETRRLFPFFPAVVARTRCSFEWEGYHFPEGRRVLLDLYGTNHDERLWDRPDEFLPDRFQNWQDDGYTLIPQGGGHQQHNHRCPGEPVVIALMKVAVSFLATRVSYSVPAQDLLLQWNRLPALPASGFRMDQIRLTFPAQIEKDTSMINRTDQPDSSKNASMPRPAQLSPRNEAQIVDEAIDESFPASDPPAHTPVTSSGARRSTADATRFTRPTDLGNDPNSSA